MHLAGDGVVGGVLRAACVVVHTVEVGPDEVALILDAQFLGQVVEHTQILVVERIAIQFVSHLPTLLLDVLEVVAGLVAPFILHPRDGARASLRHLLDAAGGTYHLRLFGVELLRHAVVADDLLALGHRLHQCVIAPVIHVHAEALQQFVGVARERDVADDHERVAVVLVGDVSARLLRPMHVVEPVLQLPCLQPGVLEVRVALVLHRPRLLVQRVRRVGPHQQVKRVARRACIRDGGPVDGRHVVCNLVILPGDELPLVSHLRHLLVGSLDGFHLWAQVVILAQCTEGNHFWLVLHCRFVFDCLLLLFLPRRRASGHSGY